MASSVHRDARSLSSGSRLSGVRQWLMRTQRKHLTLLTNSSRRQGRPGDFGDRTPAWSCPLKIRPIQHGGGWWGAVGPTDTREHANCQAELRRGGSLDANSNLTSHWPLLQDDSQFDIVASPNCTRRRSNTQCRRLPPHQRCPRGHSTSRTRQRPSRSRRASPIPRDTPRRRPRPAPR